jgi:hypothetical protein
MGGGVSRERTASAVSWDVVLWELKKRAAEVKDKASLDSLDMSALDKPLPKGWVLVHSKVYRTHFFYNREAKTSSWTRPEEDDAVAPPALVVEDVRVLDASTYSGEKHSLKRSVSTVLGAFRNSTAALKSKGVLLEVLAIVLRDAVAEQEPLMTDLMTDLAQELNGKLEGLEFRLKSPESLRQKVKRDVREANLKLLEDIEQHRVDNELAYHQAQVRSRARVKSKVRLSALDKRNAMSPLRSPTRTIKMPPLDEYKETIFLFDIKEPISPSAMSISPLSAGTYLYGDPLCELPPQDQPVQLTLSLTQDQLFEVENEMEGDLQIAAAEDEAEEIALESTAEKDLAVNLETIVWALPGH